MYMIYSYIELISEDHWISPTLMLSCAAWQLGRCHRGIYPMPNIAQHMGCIFLHQSAAIIDAYACCTWCFSLSQSQHTPPHAQHTGTGLYPQTAATARGMWGVAPHPTRAHPTQPTRCHRVLHAAACATTARSLRRQANPGKENVVHSRSGNQRARLGMGGWGIPM